MAHKSEDEVKEVRVEREKHISLLLKVKKAKNFYSHVDEDFDVW